MGRAIIQGSGIQYSIIINLSCWLLSSALISNSLNVDKMCIQTQYHWFSHQNNKKQANKNIYNTSYLCGSLMHLVNHKKFKLDKPSWAPPPSLPYMPEFANAYPLEWAVKSMIVSALSESLKQSLHLGLQTVRDLLYSHLRQFSLSSRL